MQEQDTTEKLVENFLNSRTKENKIIAVRALYLENFLITHIAKKLIIGKNTVTKILKELGIYQIEKSKKHLSKEKIERNKKIIELYMSGKTCRDIEKIMNVSNSNVSQILRDFVKNNHPQYDLRIKDKERLIRHRKYEFNFSFFNKIDTEEKAYWLGFLYADGCITDTSIKLELQSRDEGHLQKLLNSVSANTTKIIKRKDGIKSSLVFLRSKEMVADLTNNGCTKRKTFKIRFPKKDIVPKELRHHFMRGYFDGDGCIHQRKKRTGVNTFSIIGNTSFVKSYKKELFLGIKKKNDVKIYDTPTEDIKGFYIGGNKQIEKVYNFLYKNATVFLERKKEKFEVIIKRPS